MPISLTLRSAKGSPLTNNEIDGNFSSIKTEVDLKLPTASYTAADVLTKLLTVDGAGSGIDADLLDGLNTSSSDTSGDTIVTRSSGNFTAGQITATQLVGPLYLNTTDTIVFEGSTANDFETTLTVTNPTADRTITLPNVTGTVVTTGDTSTVTNTMLAGSIANAKLSNSSVTIDGTTIALGASGSILANNLTWTGTQTFIDNKLLFVDNVDTSKKLALQISNISASTTRTLTAPDADGVIATREWTGAKTISTSAPSGGTSGDVWFRI